MDILAHTLWAAAGVLAVRRHHHIAPRAAAATVALAAMPDLGHMLPMLGWAMGGDGSVAKLWAYAVALPGQEPVVPPMVEMLSHHLHCTLHSAIVAGVVTLLLWVALRSMWIPLLGWWSHILIDIFTHSQDFYPAPVLYPITRRGFDGIAWNTPWFMVLNYTALAITGAWLWRNAKRRLG
jgi:LexA-binding, inner membrane-associated putative hydrolase